MCVAVEKSLIFSTLSKKNWLKILGSFSRGIEVGIGEDLLIDSSFLVMPKNCLHVVLSVIFVLK